MYCIFVFSQSENEKIVIIYYIDMFPSCLLNVVLCIFLSDSLHVHVYIAEICEQEVIASMYLIYM